MDIFISVRKSTNGDEFYDFHGVGLTESEARSRAISFGQLISTSDWKVNEINPIVRAKKVEIPTNPADER